MSFEGDVAAGEFRQAIDGKPKETQEAILSGFLLVDRDNEKLSGLREGLRRQLKHTLGAVSQHEHFRSKPVEIKPDETEEPTKEIAVPLTETIEHDRQVLAWAETMRNQFVALPAEQPKKSDKKAAQRDRHFLINAFNDVEIGESEPLHVLYQPAVVARMFESWLATADEDETGRIDELIDLAADYLEKKIAKDWQKVPKKPWLAMSAN